jgi:hypothetical protein
LNNYLFLYEHSKLEIKKSDLGLYVSFSSKILYELDQNEIIQFAIMLRDKNYNNIIFLVDKGYEVISTTDSGCIILNIYQFEERTGLPKLIYTSNNHIFLNKYIFQNDYEIIKEEQRSILLMALGTVF